MDKLTKKEKKELKKLEWQEKLRKEKKNKMLKQVGIWIGVAVVLILSAFGLIKLAGSGTTNSTTASLPPVTKADIAKGNPKAKAVLVEYADFQCPACAAYHPLVNQLLTDFSGRIYFVYRFFPLIQIHQNAMLAAQAGYAAYLQSKFFDMYNLLFNTQTSWATSGNARDTFISYARKLNLNTQKFKRDMDSLQTKKFIQNEYNQGISAGVNSTPTFFINGSRVQNPQSYDAFRRIIQNELNK